METWRNSLGAIRRRFEPGAFGNVPERADAILHKQHDRSDPIARTGGGGLKFTDSPTTLELRATLPNTTAANDVLELVKPQEPGGQGILRGLSVEFIPDKHRIEANRDGTYTVVHQKATLRGAGVVDRPQFKESTLREEELTLREQFRALTEESGMDGLRTKILSSAWLMTCWPNARNPKPPRTPTPPALRRP